MLFALPIGTYILLGEKKNMKNYQAIFDDFHKKIVTDNDIDDKTKIELFQDMLYNNRYEVVYADKQKVIGEKKIFSVGWMFVGIGTIYVGLIIYIIYFFYFQKPHRVEFML
jgi:uncharacterized membrane protein YukC